MGVTVRSLCTLSSGGTDTVIDGGDGTRSVDFTMTFPREVLLGQIRSGVSESYCSKYNLRDAW